jgi:hypothetical protein
LALPPLSVTRLNGMPIMSASESLFQFTPPFPTPMS